METKDRYWKPNRRKHGRRSRATPLFLALACIVAGASIAVPSEVSASNAGGLPEVEKRVTVLEGDVTDLENSFNSMNVDLDVLEKDVTGLKDKVSKLENAVSALQNDVAALRKDLDSLKGAVEDLRRRVSDLQTLVDQLHAKLNSLNKLSTLADGVKKLIAWIQLPTQEFRAKQHGDDRYYITLTCPAGVPLNVMLLGPASSVSTMRPTAVPPPTPITDPEPLPVAAPGGVWMEFRGPTQPPPVSGQPPVPPFKIFPVALCLNVDALTGFAPNLDAPWIP